MNCLIFRTKTKNLISIHFEVQIVFLVLQRKYKTRWNYLQLF